MKMFLRLAAGTMMMLSLPGAVAFGQHYTQTNLVSNDSGTTPDSDLVNPWGMSRSSGMLSTRALARRLYSRLTCNFKDLNLSRRGGGWW